jgi:hypothetical protein
LTSFTFCISIKMPRELGLRCLLTSFIFYIVIKMPLELGLRGTLLPGFVSQKWVRRCHLSLNRDAAILPKDPGTVFPFKSYVTSQHILHNATSTLCTVYTYIVQRSPSATHHTINLCASHTGWLFYMCKYKVAHKNEADTHAERFLNVCISVSVACHKQKNAER